MEPLYEDYIDDAFSDALLHLKLQVEREREGAVELMAKWSGVRPSTMYAWIERTSRPSSYRFVWRLLIESTRAGYDALAAAVIAPTMCLLPRTCGEANGSLADELSRSARTWGKLLAAESAGNSSGIIDGANELRSISDAVHEEGQRMITRN